VAAKLIQAVDVHSDSPLVLDFLLNSALALGRGEEVNRVREQIAKEPKVLIEWEDWRVTGLFWSASCDPVGQAKAGGRASRCPVSPEAAPK
jgi:hypothetical protein